MDREKKDLRCRAVMSAINDYAVKYDSLRKNVEILIANNLELINELSPFVNIIDKSGEEHIIDKFETNEENEVVLKDEEGHSFYFFQFDLGSLIKMLDDIDTCMMNATMDKNGKFVFFSMCADVGENEGGFFVQVYSDMGMDNEIDNLVIHPEDLKGKSEYELAKEMIADIEY